VVDLIRHVDRTYRTYAAPEARAVEGVSMGGFGAAHFGFKFPEWFAGMTSMAGALHNAAGFRIYASAPVWEEVFGANAEYADANSPWQLAERNAAAIRDRVQVRLVIGDQDSLLPLNWAFCDWLRNRGIAYEFTVVPGVAHTGNGLYAATGNATAAFYTRLFANIGSRPAVSAASYLGPQVAPDSLVSVFGRDLDAASVTARGVAAKVLYASSGQVNFVMPALAPGPAEVRVTNGAGIVSLFAADIVPVAPGLFSAYYITDGYLILFGTGIRGGRSVRVTVGGRDCEVVYAGPQPQYAGLDQVNVRLDGASGDVVLSADGIPSNTIPF
jgi:hypothetical protein